MRGSLALLLAFALSACSEPTIPPPAPPTPSSTPFVLAPPPAVPTPGVSFAPIDGDLARVPPDAVGPLEEDLEPGSLAMVLTRTLDALAARPRDERVRLADAVCSRADLTAALEDLRAEVLRGAPLAPVLTRRFRFYRSLGRPEGPLVTGYYEPVLDARRRRTRGFEVPIYRKPHDLIEVPLAEFVTDAAGRRIFGRLENERLAPYLARKDIDGRRALAGRSLEIAWLADPVDVFFLHIQGSGLLRFEDGSAERVGFAASNGRAYTSIGRVLLDEGALVDASAPGIQRWLRAHPAHAADVMSRNERYIFFRTVDDGPIGALGVVLTPGRSVAVDPTRYPLGSLAWLATSTPLVDGAGNYVAPIPARRLVVAQDAGAAITGPGRLDLYFGTGALAGKQAGVMSANGELTLLFPECG